MSIIKSFSARYGDMFYIDCNSGNFTTIVCCYNDKEKYYKDLQEIYSISKKKGITCFISSHPDEGPIKGIQNFCVTVGISYFYCVENAATKTGESESFKQYCELRGSSKAFLFHKGVHANG